MADKRIGELPGIAILNNDALIPVEQQGDAHKMTGRQFADFARESAEADVQRAVDAAGKAETAAKASAGSAEKAEQYSGKPPIIQDRTWWVWNVDKQEYVDTGEIAVGNVMYATFFLDPATGELYMYYDKEYTGPQFRLNGADLEVVLLAG